MSHGKTAAFALLVALLLSAGCDDDANGAPARHVIFISLDTTRADHFGFYGNTSVQTPHLDRLATESIVFDDFMTVVPTTLASHATLFSGKYPHSHGTPRNGFTVNEENVLLAELLRERDFETAGFVASFPLEHRFGIDQGFEHYDDSFDLLAHEAPVMQDERSAAAVTDAALAYLDGRQEPRGLFLFVHYFDPHAPYAAPPPYDTLYDPRGREGVPEWAELVDLCKGGGSPDLLRRAEAQYAAEISYMDEHVGRLLEALESRGILDEALLVVTSDHGELFAEHPETVCYDHGWMTYQQDVRAVGLVRLPGGARGGTRVSGLVAGVDILPTVLGYLGIPVPEGVDGEPLDFAKLPRSGDGRLRFAEATKPWNSVETDPRWKNLLKPRCVRRGNYKLLQVPYARYEALYDLEQDPQEKNNLLAAPTKSALEVARELRAELARWTESADPLPSEFITSQRDEVIERLRNLGYVGGP